MLSFTEIASIFKTSQKSLVYCGVSILILFVILYSESLLSANLITTTTSRMFDVPPTSIQNLYIKYDFDSPEVNYQQSLQAPKILSTKQKPASFKVLNSTFIALNNDTQINTLVFTRNRFHAVLIEGEIILNNTTEIDQVSVQVGNLLLSPYSNGIYYLSKRDNNLTVQILDGNADAALYDRNGFLKRQILLSKYNKIENFDAFPLEGDFEILKPETENQFQQIVHDQKLIPTDQNLFVLNYKGQQVSPQDQSKLSEFLANLSINSKRKNYKTISGFYYELNSILTQSSQRAITPADISKLRALYNTNIATNVQSLTTFREALNSKYPFILSLRPNDNAYELKLYLETVMTEVPPSKKIISSLEDLYYLYPENRTATITKSFESLKEIIPAVGKEDSLNIISILDNLAETIPASNTRDLFEARNALSKKLSTTIEKSQFRTKSKQHLLRLQLAHSLHQLPTIQIRSATEALLSSLDSTSQIEYQDFLLQLR